jgi:diaminohydroxyphosphoribosylaminopyrimidine deaminase/5-amino-6-(5-phosphoribosylamino)uracil reductase
LSVCGDDKIRSRFMSRALRLARRGAGRVSPNPMVGAVVVRNGRVVGEAYHGAAGKPHAEALALKEAGRRSSGADLYVNLEPCCHHGRTPPCTDEILRAGIGRVWVAILDPNPLVRGRGIRTLRRRGVEVNVGLFAEEAARLNESYLTYVQTGRPFVVAKLATTLDGKIATATGESRWISGPSSRRRTHRLRHEADAIIVGAGTVIADDPELTVRMGARQPRHPVRIVLDTKLRIPLGARVLAPSEQARTVVACGRGADRARIEALRSRGIEVWRCAVDSNRRVDIRSVVGRIGREGLSSVLIEGGREVIASALKAGVVDKLLVFVAPKILGGGACEAVGDLGVKKLSRAISLTEGRGRRVGEDFLIEGYLPAKGKSGRCSPDWWKKLAGLSR